MRTLSSWSFLSEASSKMKRPDLAYGWLVSKITNSLGSVSGYRYLHEFVRLCKSICSGVCMVMHLCGCVFGMCAFIKLAQSTSLLCITAHLLILQHHLIWVFIQQSSKDNQQSDTGWMSLLPTIQIRWKHFCTKASTNISTIALLDTEIVLPSRN